MDVLVTCMYEEDPIKNEGARVVTILYSNFSDAQGQITLVLVSVSGRNLNSSKLSCMSLLPARMRMIDSKMKELECSQDFSHYKSMGIFPDAQGQLTPQSLVRSGRISNSSEMLWMFSLHASSADRPIALCRTIRFVCLIFCFMSTVNSLGHVEKVSYPNHTYLEAVYQYLEYI